MAKQRKGVTTKRKKTQITIYTKSSGRRIGAVKQLKNGKWAAYGRTGGRLPTRVGGPKPKRGRGHKSKANAVNRVARGVGIKK